VRTLRGMAGWLVTCDQGTVTPEATAPVPRLPGSRLVSSDPFNAGRYPLLLSCGMLLAPSPTL